MTFHVGTSGFSYKEWKGFFYPAEIRDKEMLAFYASKLGAVEINNTFYRIPKRSVLQGWASETPDHFKFVIKASRRITHQKRLKDTEEPMSFLIKNVAELSEKLGAVLFQLPPNMRCNLDRLKPFLDLIPKEIPAAIEFRHESWFDDNALQCLRDQNIAVVHADSEDSNLPLVATADWGYLRLRGPEYNSSALQSWADQAHESNFKNCQVFFKHEDEAAGPRLAMTFQNLVNTGCAETA